MGGGESVGVGAEVLDGTGAPVGEAEGVIAGGGLVGVLRLVGLGGGGETASWDGCAQAARRSTRLTRRENWRTVLINAGATGQRGTKYSAINGLMSDDVCSASKEKKAAPLTCW